MESIYARLVLLSELLQSAAGLFALLHALKNSLDPILLWKFISGSITIVRYIIRHVGCSAPLGHEERRQRIGADIGASLLGSRGHSHSSHFSLNFLCPFLIPTFASFHSRAPHWTFWGHEALSCVCVCVCLGVRMHVHACAVRLCVLRYRVTRNTPLICPFTFSREILTSSMHIFYAHS